MQFKEGRSLGTYTIHTSIGTSVHPYIHPLRDPLREEGTITPADLIVLRVK